ncbi:hypothetical protein [Flavitalea sp.]|nr:hypothetical protein [Flavitalea sp.]
MSAHNDPNIKDDKKKFPVREGQGKDSSIRSENNKASGDDSGNSESYPEPGTEDKKHKNQDEYNYIDKEKQNESV